MKSLLQTERDSCSLSSTLTKEGEGLNCQVAKMSIRKETMQDCGGKKAECAKDNLIEAFESFSTLNFEPRG